MTKIKDTVIAELFLKRHGLGLSIRKLAETFDLEVTDIINILNGHGSDVALLLNAMHGDVVIPAEESVV